ncbi:MAG: helix-turn-helix transcriptional regulator [Prochloraceae cyanobacterium]|nr:helix-turn-helix transcriptional regulator [Prochloraceae cyanobacterium]
MYTLGMKAVLNISKVWKPNDTVGKVAEALGVSRKTVSQLKKGTEKGDWITLIKVSEYYGVKLEELLEIEDD